MNRYMYIYTQKYLYICSSVRGSSARRGSALSTNDSYPGALRSSRLISQAFLPALGQDRHVTRKTAMVFLFSS